MHAQPDFIVPLADVSAGLSQLGGKGASLAHMAAAGLPVPPGFHITTAAYRRFVAAHELQAQILVAAETATPDQPATLEEASSQIGRLFAQGAMPDDIASAIRQAYMGLGERNMPVAVRSSATAEDLPGASFAGQQETYLNMRGEAMVLDAVKRCWAALWTARAIAYRIKNRIDQNTVALAVVVQSMVNADAAGILFTANPVNGRRDEIVINAAWGLGEAIVGGSVSPDTIVADKATGKIKTMAIAEKTIATVMTASGTEEQPLDKTRRKSQVLKAAQVIQLVRIARRIEDYYGTPQDIEWCQANGSFYIVQARPITALPEPPLEWHLSQEPHAIASRVSFVEFVPDVVSPLFATLAVPLANQATSKMMAEIVGLRGKDGYYFEAVNGYVYGCFDTRQLLRCGVGGILATSKIFRYGKARRKEVQANSRALAARWRQTNLAALPAVALLAGVRELFGATADYFTMAQSGPIPLSTWSELLFSRFYNTLVKRKSDPAAMTFLLGLENLPLQAEKSLFDLAQWVQG